MAQNSHAGRASSWLAVVVIWIGFGVGGVGAGAVARSGGCSGPASASSRSAESSPWPSTSSTTSSSTAPRMVPEERHHSELAAARGTRPIATGPGHDQAPRLTSRFPVGRWPLPSGPCRRTNCPPTRRGDSNFGPRGFSGVSRPARPRACAATLTLAAPWARCATSAPCSSTRSRCSPAPTSWSRTPGSARSAGRASSAPTGTASRAPSSTGRTPPACCPIEDWPLYAFRRRDYLERGYHWHRAPEQAAKEVLARLRADGPLTATGLGGAKKGGEWFDRTDHKIAAEYLLAIGEVVCTRRRAGAASTTSPSAPSPPPCATQDLSDDECVTTPRTPAPGGRWASRPAPTWPTTYA